MIDLVSPLLIFLLGVPFLSRAQRGVSAWERRLLLYAYLAQLFGVFAIIGVLKYYYGYGDMLSYHYHGGFIADYMHKDLGAALPRVLALLFQSGGEELAPWGAGSSTGSMHAMSGILNFLLGKSLFAICGLIALLSFFAKLAIYMAFRDELPRRVRRPVCIATLMVPTVVFWSSGLAKESIATVFLGMMVAGGHRLLRKRGAGGGLIWLIVGTVGCGLFKGYLLLPFALATITLVYVRRAHRTGRSVFSKPSRLVAAVVVAFASLVAIGSIFPRYDFRKIEEQITEEQELGSRSKGDSNFELQSGGSTSSAGLILGAPWAIATALLRPAIVEARNPLALLNGLETLFFTIGLLQALFRRGFRGCFSAIRNSSILSFCAVFTLVLALGVGFSTTNMGTLSRYRMPLVPFFVVILAVLRSKDQPRVAEATR